MTPRERAIARIAYHLWLLSGRLPDREIENWLRAEAILDDVLEVCTLRIRVFPITVSEPREN